MNLEYYIAVENKEVTSLSLHSFILQYTQL